MDVGTLSDFIANNGFPILMCCILIYRDSKITQSTTSAINELTTSTKEMQAYVKDSIDKVSDTVEILKTLVNKFIGE